MLAVADTGNSAVVKKVSSTIAKDLGQKGRARYLAQLDMSWDGQFSDRNAKKKEAILVAWSELE